MKALVLTGGGARGAYEAGVVKGLVDAGQTFDLVCGTSIGAINAAFYAQDELPQLETIWKSIAGKNVIEPTAEVQSIENFVTGLKDFLTIPKIVWPFHILGILRLYHAIGPLGNLSTLMSALNNENIGGVIGPGLNIDNLKRSLIVSATNVTLQTSEAFGAFAELGGLTVNNQQARFQENIPGAKLLNKDNFLKVVEASAAIPFAFPAINMNLGTTSTFQYVDGGVANNTPIGLAIAAGATDVTVVFMDPLQSVPTPQGIDNAAELAMACYSVMQQKILGDDVKLALMTNIAVAAQSADKISHASLSGKALIALREIRPASPLPVSVMSFGDQAGMNSAFDAGYADGKGGGTTIWPVPHATGTGP
jgi:predicted acylesterase/phospholipase RssA